MQTALISKCLLGKRCRYDGKVLKKINLEKLNNYRLFPVCPEMDGGLPCPRPFAEIESGDGCSVLERVSDVIDSFGENVTDNYLDGANIALETALKEGAGIAFLKDKSPSCGVNQIYVQGKLKPGMGVTAALLSRNGIKIVAVE